MSRLSNWLRPSTIARAHCDVPCSIHDPSEAVLAAADMVWATKK